jgi:predicted RNA binding protein YcfA (HicA-like mRNA interferase family)
MTFREVEKLVKSNGWYLVNVEGSHYHYRHPTIVGKVQIPKHGGDIKPKTLSSILKAAGLK